MTDKEKNGCKCGEECHDHDEPCDCEGEECESNTITIELEDGSSKDFIVLDVITHEGKQYMALAEVDSMEYDIMSWEVDGENVELSVIEDDAEFNAVAAKFEELFQNYEEEPED
ncbi:MAG: DUF1292 domain-containing protein [Candidatus Cloacimonetes bacterium]|jgi:hypothetical protein|nr:DUF1292 domain-containing protein [Candidatus Cloacimonadota bacterium]MDD3142666.1 DUF1292 domain-containing protein [Candidatus Cloacimonadota bacterium]MDY0367178.1 DUF1292 domain-containing protein [Candidatus Syntrophosphaera sp.]HOY84663.1 DUF1292 domain-containing protein [Candidatus Syntrophosphaera sp.]HPH60408.1 DUF1292 domain-containing protein [Candidatus Syntrophosphaera sp.]